MGALILLLLVTTRRIRQKQQEQPSPVVVEASEVDEPTVAQRSAAVDAAADVAVADVAVAEPEVELAEWLSVQAALETAQQQRAAAEQRLSERSQRYKRSLEELEQHRGKLVELQQSLEDARQRQQSVAATAADAGGQLKKLRQEQADLQRRLQQLQLESEQSATELANAETLAVAAEQLVSRRNSALQSLRQISAQQSETQRDVGVAETMIEFSNSSGTSRTPVVVDLTGEGFLFPASGITVRRKDMEGVSATDNPLLSGVLAVHRQRSADSVASRPYVLLLVRPGGTLDFYLAQRVFKASQIHFGYELMDADQQVATAEPAEGEVEAVRMAVLNSLMRRQKYYDATSALQRRIAALQEAQRGRSGSAGVREQRESRPGSQPFEGFGEPIGEFERRQSGVPPQVDRSMARSADASGVEAGGESHPAESEKRFARSGAEPERQRPGAGGPGDGGWNRPPEEPWQAIPSYAEARTHVEQELARALAEREQSRSRSSGTAGEYAPSGDQYQTSRSDIGRPSGGQLAQTPSATADSAFRGAEPMRHGTETTGQGSQSAGAMAQGQPVTPPMDWMSSPGAGNSSDIADRNTTTQQPVRYPPLDGQTFRPHDTSPGAAGTASGPGGRNSGQASLAASGLVSYRQVTIYLDPQHYTVSGQDSVALHGQPISQITRSLATRLYEISQRNRHPLAEVTLPSAKFVVSPGAHTLYLQVAAKLHDMNIPVSSVVTMDAHVPWPGDRHMSRIAPLSDVLTQQVSDRKVLP